MNGQFKELRGDCLLAASLRGDLRDLLKNQHIAITGGTGFLGSWIAETVAALNDEYGLEISLDIYARNVADWSKKYPHLALRNDIHTISQDVRSPFLFDARTSYVVHAAGIPDNRVHASDPLRVHQTIIYGMDHALEAASKLPGLKRLINVSSCLVNGTPNRAGALVESDCFPMQAGELHTVYREAKRAAESLCSVYRSQFRMPVSTVRPFTFVGPYQELDRPWAINNFMLDAIRGTDIRILGDGSARRSYLYGSDAAWWTMVALVTGGDGQIYNLGSDQPIAHVELAKIISDLMSIKVESAIRKSETKQRVLDDLYPDMSNTQKILGIVQTCSLEQAISKTYRWYSCKKQNNHNYFSRHNNV
ncbi:dTDP-glucose 4,6-dehydratase [Janthinobacterium sp. BJB426]|uniref:NAD-dependent epimerase/dehydratase family protein n=1 Tax=Janthinobacterium sp. BJB426 TaxID=2048010 RepID=UPI000C11AC23|nr:NAD(P)-dependent oxidoreductase [Janthinobacterium sp. BJB426]PHV29696.1 dTDP-glucose 4,6-dehydratase [Janthinobacterium sp. BJB426]